MPPMLSVTKILVMRSADFARRTMNGPQDFRPAPDAWRTSRGIARAAAAAGPSGFPGPQKSMPRGLRAARESRAVADKRGACL
jgi:hypothetical protein